MEEPKDTKDDKKTKRTSKSVNQLPLARIKRIIKTDPDVKLISTDAALLITRATELFIEYLTKQAYENTQAENRKVLHYKDLSKCVSETEILDFIADIIPQAETKQTIEKKRKKKAEEVKETKGTLLQYFKTESS